MGTPTFASRIDEFHEQAASLVGYRDFGVDDGYRANLEYLLECADNDVDWTELGRQAFPQRIVGLLCGRLYAQKGFARFPDCLDQRIVKPIIVVGFRSGTTLFHKLLASVPNTQTLEFWLASFPMPRPPRDTWEGFPPFENVRSGLEQIGQLVPDFHAMHSMSADEADESHRADKTLTNPGQIDNLLSPRFLYWTFKQDQSKAYDRFYKVLQLIGYRNSSKWVLKCPFHMGWIEQTLRKFPDATVIHTYRDPSNIIPSVCSIAHTFLSPFQKLDKKQVGEFVLDFFGTLLDRYVDSQSNLKSGNFFDIDYKDIVSDPIGCVRKAYIKSDGCFSRDQENVVARYYENDRQGQHGKHSYSAEEYGLSKAMIRERVKKYLDFYAL